MIKTRIDRIHHQRHLNHRDRRPKRHLTNLNQPMEMYQYPRPRLEVEEAARMSAQRLPETDQTIYAVREWKETLDPCAKWWQRWFHRFVYLPFNEFSLKVVKIPPVTSATIEGGKVTFTWLEDSGFFSDEHQADCACLTERWSYQGMTFGRIFPSKSAQCVGPTIFPRAKRPRKRAEPILSMVISPLKEHERIKEELARLHEILDQ